MTLPAQYHLQPYLAVPDAQRAIAFYVDVFGFIEHYRLPMEDGRLAHVELARGDARLLLSDPCLEIGATPPEAAWPVSMVLYVEDVDAVIVRAEQAGATIIASPKDEFFGDRTAKLLDPSGHRWFIHEMKEALEPAEVRRRYVELTS